MILTSNQKEILNLIKDYNLIVYGPPGTGKTTLAHLIKELYKDVLLIQRNKTNNMFTFHSFFNKYYSKCYNDMDLLNIIERNTPPKEIILFNYIIIDNSQDLDELTYKSILKIQEDFSVKRLLLFGDIHQNLFSFNNSSIKYFTMGYYFFGITRKIELNINFTFGQKFYNFLKAIGGPENIQLEQSSRGPENENIQLEQGSEKEIFYLFDNPKDYMKEYPPGDTVILCPSINLTIRKLTNEISEYNIPIYLSDLEQSGNSENKLLITTFHKCQNINRKYIFIYNFDESYQLYFNTSCKSLSTANSLYMALTRPCSKLFLIHQRGNRELSFINLHTIKPFVTFIGKYKEIKKQRENLVFKEVHVTKLIKSFSITEIKELITCIHIIHNKKSSQNLKTVDTIERTVINKKIIENVSDINAVAIMYYFEYQTTGKISQLSVDDQKYLDSLNKKTSLISDFLYLACPLYRRKQIGKFDWFNENIFIDCIDSLNNLILKKDDKIIPDFEVSFSKFFNNVKLIGTVDIMDNKSIYEIKYTSELTELHIIQLSIYAYLSDFLFDYYLYNITDGKEINLTIENPEKFGEILFEKLSTF